MKQNESLIDPIAFLAWLKLSVYMTIVSVAIVLSFHLKSQPSPLGMYKYCLFKFLPDLYCRATFCITAGYRLLGLIHGMYACGLVQLYQHCSKV